MTALLDSNDIGQLWQRLRLSAQQTALWLDLARDYAKYDLPWQAAYAARQALRLDATLEAEIQSLQIVAWQDATAGDALLGRATLANAALLAEHFHAHVKACPGDWLTWLYLARLLEINADSTRNSQAKIQSHTQALAQACALEVIAGESLHWLGVWRLNAGDDQAAVAAFSGLLDIRPVRHGSMMYLAEALLRVGNVAAAEKSFARASLSSNVDFLISLAARVYSHNYWQEAIQVLEKALALSPKNVAGWLALAKIQWEIYQLTDAQNSCRHVLDLNPSNHEVTYLLAALPGRMGDAKAHLAAVQERYAKQSDPLSRLASSIAMAALYHDELAPAAVADLHRDLCAPIAAAFTAKTDFSNEKNLMRRLRIGYVSGDFHRQHPVNIFMLPVLQKHDHATVEVFIYHTGTMQDEYTRQARACADHWLEAALLDDKTLQQSIISDQIDILIDLAGHTSSHRLGVFALRAAPVQATFLGYPHSTGLSSIDWIVGDATVTPAAHASLFSEGLAQLPGSVFCWAPVDEYALPRTRPASAPVVFGSFNNAMKISPRTIALWAAVLKAVPDARLLLKAPSFRDPGVQQYFADLFAQAGIERQRIEFRGPCGLADMMQEYGDMDIGLDPMPYNGGTTTLQALWMGIPVICMAGGNFVSRMGASFLSTLKHTDWLADDEREYVNIAVRLAARCAELRSSRPAFRAAMAASPLCDITHYTQDIEALYQKMWAHYCNDTDRKGSSARLIAATPENQ